MKTKSAALEKLERVVEQVTGRSVQSIRDQSLEEEHIELDRRRRPSPRLARSATPAVDLDDLAFALEYAADCLDAREWGEEGSEESKAQKRADLEAARRIRRMAKRLFK